MDQEDTMDFKALRAKFQDEELLLKQPRIKPALPEKPKLVLPPQSPPHYLPAGARPSLLTSINQTLDRKTTMTPNVVFKDEKKESKKPLIQSKSKGKDKSGGKLKKAKDKTKGSKEEQLVEDSLDQKQKKETIRHKKFPLVPSVAPKDSTAELVAATPPPKATPGKKMGFLGFRKSSRRDSDEVTADPILDTPSSDVPGPAPLIPVPSDISHMPPQPEISAPKALLPNIPALFDYSTAEEITPPFTIPTSPNFTPPPAFVPEVPSPELSFDIVSPALPVSRPASQNEIIQSIPSAVPTPPPSRAISGPPPVASSPSPSPPESESAAKVGIASVNIDTVELPPPPVIPSSPKPERLISALSALERAEDMDPGKRTLCDQRIFNALEKARKKTTSLLTTPTTSYSVTPPPEELAPPQSPTHPLSLLPPIDYEDRAGNALPSKPAQVNGFDYRQESPVLEGVTDEGSDLVPQLLVVPPPPPKKVTPASDFLGPAPQKPVRPPFLNLSEFIPPPPVEDNEIPALPEFSETDTTDVPEFDDVTSDAYSSELPLPKWGNDEYAGTDSPDGQNLPEFYSNGITTPGAEVHAAPAFGDNALAESSITVSQEYPPQAGLQAGVDNGIYESTEYIYEDIAMPGTKKKGKTDGGKKRRGTPKNPYAEAAQEANEEKSKTGRFSKGDKKAAAEGPDEKELKKKEKQRLEKEKKELKEKQEREKKEHKEREKKENEMKKTFKITGQEDAMYKAKVTVTTKGRKNDLPVNSGDTISIIRTTNCPKGKWLARDSSSNYGYVAVDHVELDIKEMLELGKKAAVTRKTNNNNVIEAEATSMGSRASNHYPLSAESFSDDSEEWTGDDDEPLSPPPDSADALASMGHTRTLSMPDVGNKDLSINHQHSHSDMSPDGSDVQARHEALQKLATFFHSPKPVKPAASSTEPETSPALVKEEEVHLPEATSTRDVDIDQTATFILPPPDLYADLTVE